MGVGAVCVARCRRGVVHFIMYPGSCAGRTALVDLLRLLRTSSVLVHQC